ncbi:50S ribosomal protein L6 [Clostridiaceae bacterium HSG29]|nr:50S ribosomal protein L6 [Clostridiaceae bacterium HSG29]
MSRIGKMPVKILDGVTVTIKEGNTLVVKGKMGELTDTFNNTLTIKEEDGNIIVGRPDDTKTSRSLHGLTRSLIANMVEGVTNGYEKKLLINGVGYRAKKQGSKLELSLGFSHPVIMIDPDGITTECPENTTIIVKGINKQLVGNYAAKIRAWRKPEPYKGKGIKYENEHIRRKEGKLAN